MEVSSFLIGAGTVIVAMILGFLMGASRHGSPATDESKKPE